MFIFLVVSSVGGIPENTQTLAQRVRSHHTPVLLEDPLLEEIALDTDYKCLEQELNWFIIHYTFNATHVN